MKNEIIAPSAEVWRIFHIPSQSFLVFFSSDAAHFGYKSKTWFISVTSDPNIC